MWSNDQDAPLRRAMSPKLQLRPRDVMRTASGVVVVAAHGGERDPDMDKGRSESVDLVAEPLDGPPQTRALLERTGQGGEVIQGRQ